MGVKVTGDAELLANLNKLQFGVAKEARAAVRDGAQKFADKLKSNTPEWNGETDMSGHLRDDIKLSSVRETSGLTEVDVGYGKDTGWRAHFPNSGTSMQDPQHFIEETRKKSCGQLLSLLS